MFDLYKIQYLTIKINHIGSLYAENEIKLLWSIRRGTIYDEDQTRQQCDWSYECGLR